MTYVYTQDTRFFLIPSLKVRLITSMPNALKVLSSSGVYWANRETKMFSNPIVMFPAEPDFIIDDTEAINRGFSIPILIIPIGGSVTSITSRWSSGSVYIVQLS